MTAGFTTTLQCFVAAKVEFILVGGLAAVLRGAPVQTYDVDLVHSRDAANIDRLIQVLSSIDAVFRAQPWRQLRPNESHLAGKGHLNLLTRYGPVDLLGSIGQPGLTYEELLPFSNEIALGEGLQVRVLTLEKQIEIKEQLSNEKDRLMLPILRGALEKQRQSK